MDASQPGFFFTSAQIAYILGSAITATGAIAILLIKLIYGNMKRQVDGLQKSIKHTEVQQYNTMRMVFVLLSRLHPDKADLVIAAMNEAFEKAGPRDAGNAARAMGPW